MTASVDRLPDTQPALKLSIFVDRQISHVDLLQSIQAHIRELDSEFPTHVDINEVGDCPYLAEHYKLVVTPALVKAAPLPAHVLAGHDLIEQLEVWWPRWQEQLRQSVIQADRKVSDVITNGTYQSTDLLRLSEELFQLRQHQAELKEQLFFKDRILAMLAHDLRNPLAATSLAVETLEQHGERLEPEMKRQLLEHARAQTRKMEQMIDDILQAARGTAAELTLSTAEVQLTDICWTALEDVRDRAAAKQLQLDTDIPPRLPTVHADRDKIRQVLINLLDNAVKYTPAGGTIRLGVLHRTTQKIEVSVSDTGPGVPVAEQERIFSDSVRLSRDRAREGYGIGLSSCRRIIRAHYGRIWVMSSSNEGSSFHFTLPIFRP
ncbi:MAG: histidine kinase [Cyanobacteria bacterium J06642_2]